LAFYFDRFEDRRPPPPLDHSAARELLWQYLATLCLALGGAYIVWRWTRSLNYDALWFAVPLAVAETGAYIGLVLFTINLWRVRDLPVRPPPSTINECLEQPYPSDRPIAVDVFLATYNEDPELVRLGIRDAVRLRYPHPIALKVHVLDDGRRPAMRAVAEAEGANYITRSTNAGYKAGNLRNAMEVTAGDFIVICDADTRAFDTLLERTLGYFRDPKMAWVQTPQWFYDLPDGHALPSLLRRRAGSAGAWLGRAIEWIVGPVRVGEDPFVNDPKMFYDVILRRRNWANAAFCCGAGSIHRREAVMEAALRSYGAAVDRATDAALQDWRRATKEREIAADLRAAVRSEAVVREELTPYKFHVSEDIYTSLVLHSDRERGWKSYMHPWVESKMLSPQDLVSWTVQRFKYAGGTLDICFHDNPLFRPGLTLAQRLMYAATFWSYLGGIWNAAFLLSPIVYFVTGIAPLAAYSSAFFLHIMPFLVSLELAMMVGTWGLSGYRGKASYLAFFPVNLRALWTVLRGHKISFPVTPKQRQGGRHLSLVWPQLAVIGLTAGSVLYALGAYLLGFGGFRLGGIVANALWGLNNIVALLGIVRAALWTPEDSDEPAA
jgi:cellulose synthase (UDP-forming)